MKRVISLIGLFILLGTTFSFAQVQEVKGVSSGIVCYEHCSESSESRKTYGFEYENLNTFAVTIEAEMWRNAFGRVVAYGQPGELLADTKTFVLNPGEKYIWKVNMCGTVGEYSPNLGKVPLAKEGYFTKFKAFKNE